MPEPFDNKLILLFGTNNVTPEQKSYLILVDRYHNNMVTALKPIPKGLENTIPQMIVKQEEKYFLEGTAAAGSAEKYLADVKKLYPQIVDYPAFIKRAEEFAPSLIKTSASTIGEAEAESRVVKNVVAIEEQALEKTAATAAERKAMTNAAKKIMSVVAGPLGNAAAVAEIAKILIDNQLIHPDIPESMAKYSNPERATQSQADIVANEILNQLVNEHAPSR